LSANEYCSSLKPMSGVSFPSCVGIGVSASAGFSLAAAVSLSDSNIESTGFWSVF
jgi:hypothetical protein